MKKPFAILSVVALVLTGCAKENFSNKAVAGDEIAVSFVADMNPSGTRATIDNDGKGVNADQCRLQIYLNKGDNATLLYNKVKPVSALKATFSDITLIKDQNYDFIFWADNAAGDFYDTDSLKEVKLKGDYIGCKDARDAFFAAFNETVTAPLSKTVELYRPFAQLNIITNDVQAVKAQVPAESVASVLPNKVKVKYTAPDKFNALTGEASGSKEFTYEAATYTDLVASTAELNTLSMDYIFASETKSVNTIDFTAKNDTPTSAISDIVLKFENIPLQRNWRTNITGSLLTNAAVITVEIKPDWDGEHNFVEGSVAAANEVPTSETK